MLHFQNWYVTKLREACSSEDTTIYVDNPPTVQTGILVLEGKNKTKREIIFFSYSGSGYALTDCVRGYEGTTPTTHNVGASVEMSITAGMLESNLNMMILNGYGSDKNNPVSQDFITNKLNRISQVDITKNKIKFSTQAQKPSSEPGVDIVWFKPV